MGYEILLTLTVLNDFIVLVFYLCVFSFQLVWFIQYQIYNSQYMPKQFIHQLQMKDQKKTQVKIVKFTLFSYSYFYKCGLIDMNKTMNTIDPRVLISRPYYSFQNQEAQLSYKLYQLHNNIKMVYEAIENKKITINKQKEFNQKIQHIIKAKQSKISKHHQTSQALDEEINFYKQYLQNLNQSISELKKKLDEELQSYLYVNIKSNPVKLENQYIQTLSLNDLMGPKCKFTPHVMNYSWQIEVEKHDEQLYIWKTNDQPSYIFAYNYHPLPSKGIVHFSFSVEFAYQPKFLLGVTNHKNISQNTQHIYFNSQAMQIQKNGQVMSKVQGQINNQSMVTIIINCDVWVFFIIVDQVLLCQADLSQMRDQYIYFFIGLTCTDTVLKFDHSIA